MTKINFKGKNLSRTVVTNNILKVYAKASKSELSYDWYADANSYAQHLATTYKITIQQAVGVISALSPRKEWQLNKRIADDLLKYGGCGQIGIFVKKALDIVKSGNSEPEILKILNGQKISAFYLNIMHPASTENVTIDRHAIAIALGRVASDKEQALTGAQYDFFKQCYKRASMKMNIKPLLMQSITWDVWKRIK